MKAKFKLKVVNFEETFEIFGGANAQRDFHQLGFSMIIKQWCAGLIPRTVDIAGGKLEFVGAKELDDCMSLEYYYRNL